MSVNSIGSVPQMKLENLKKLGTPQNGRQVYEANTNNGAGFRIDIEAKDAFEFEKSYKDFQTAVNNFDETKVAKNSARYEKKAKNLTLISLGSGIVAGLTPAVLMFSKMKTAWKYPLGVLAGIVSGVAGFMGTLVIGTKNMKAQVDRDMPEIAATANFQKTLHKLNARITPLTNYSATRPNNPIQSD